MDELDRQILALLTENARMTVKEMAGRVNLTSPAVSERIRRMERKGIIQGYTVRINTNYQEEQINALISLSVPIADRPAFRSLLETQQNNLKCYHVTGEHSYIIRVRCRDIAALEHILSQLQTVGHTNTQIILSDMPVAGPQF